MYETNRFNFIVKQLQPDGIFRSIRKDIHNKPTDRKLTRLKDKIGFLKIELMHQLMQSIKVQLFTHFDGPAIGYEGLAVDNFFCQSLPESYHHK